MKISNARVTDPRLTGVYQDPVLLVDTDEPVYEQGEPITHPLLKHVRAVPCGPFFAIEKRDDDDSKWEDYENTDSSISSVNKLPDIIGNQLVPVAVNTPEGVLDLAISVARARRLMRRARADIYWRVVVDEQAALLGDLKWRVELRNPVCYGGAVIASDRCKSVPTHTIVYKNTHLNLCGLHVQDHQHRMRSQRTASN